ncbi:MAG: L-glutamate gamma-semialdehyde dehydrogenase [Candidatus Niyogibacteria bacterium]|nr:L-glutamate gamma-semialdehyde dehydrogenase [Candidatus Niyogibacteria bacterium]
MVKNNTDGGRGERLLVPRGFKPEPLTDFSLLRNRLAMKTALEFMAQKIGRNYPIIVGGTGFYLPQLASSLNPARANWGEVVGLISQAEERHANEAMRAAHDAFPEWSARGVHERARILRRAAQIMRERRFDLAAMEVYEVSKTWREADADVAEAIDFLEYYAGMAEHLMPYRPTEVLLSESNEFGYEGRGVAVVIAPWNFPIAIATGMCAAALATGNTVVFKPATSASMCGYKLVRILMEAGVPAGVINLLTGAGSVLGEALVKNEFTKNILFTGSKAVGFQLIKWAAEADFADQRQVRRVTAELGGKNAVVVDASADMDQAIFGIMRSAFGFQGQKCSACSRVIVHDSIHDEFVRRLVGAASSLQLGDPEDPATDIGAVIDKAAFERVNRYIKIGFEEGATLEYQEEARGVLWRGYFVGPAIFSNVLPTSRLAQEEIFGPVLAVIRAESFAAAIAVANDSEYHLTGGIYSRTEEHLALARRELRVGNLYINRGVTGAVVGRQPFGGFGASGTGPKAGGPDYLVPLMEARTITESLVRRGFSPKLKN